MAGDSTGDILTSTDPAAGANAWTKTTVDPEAFITAVSCPSTSLCVATGQISALGGAGQILTSTNPTGGAGAWRRASIASGGLLTAVSCPSVSLCVAADGEGSLVTSTDPAGGASTWTHATLSERLYSRDDHGTQVVDAAPAGQGNTIGDISLGGDSLTLSWTHGATQRQLELH